MGQDLGRYIECHNMVYTVCNGTGGPRIKYVKGLIYICYLSGRHFGKFRCC